MTRTITRLSLPLLALPLLFGLSACSLKHTTVPGAPIPFASADYTVLGNTNAEECGTYILGIDFAHLFSNQAATISGATSGDPLSAILGLIFGPRSPEASRALYMALEKIPEATHLLAPRIHETVSGIPLGPWVLFGQRCAVVDARGVVIGEKPVPNAQ
ncbi:MAG: hypothetical protein D6729_08005 [Deltaproteobacteria bacterium]|nr:MAG: hypothetical protein D6729_08005 [Deltaproteobacteria bacterium]